MKFVGILSALVVIILLAFAPSAMSEGDPLPNSGNYFIVSADTKEALQPNGPTCGQNVFLAEYNQGGTQKWTIKRKIDPKTKKPLNSYTIKLMGDATDRNLQPFPATDHTCMIGMDVSTYTLAQAGSSFIIKNSTLNGDALCAVPSPPGPTEARFGPSDGSTKFQWDFIPAN